MAEPEQKVVRRSADLVVADMADELVVFDERTKEAHALNASSAAVWRAIERPSSVSEIVRGLASTFGADSADEAVRLALRDFAKLGLLDDTTGQGAVSGAVSRRQILRRLVAAGVAVPVIASVKVTHAFAAVTSPTSCNNPVTDCSVNPDPLFKCNTQTLCFCITTTESANVCIQGHCETLPCTASNQCPPGWVCWSFNCCTQRLAGPQTAGRRPQAPVSGNCMPLCGTALTLTQLTTAAGTSSWWSR